MPSLAPILAFAFPVSDWQFWVATAVVGCALVWVVRAVVPISLLTGKRRPPPAKKVSLTIGGEKAPAGKAPGRGSKRDPDCGCG